MYENYLKVYINLLLNTPYIFIITNNKCEIKIYKKYLFNIINEQIDSNWSESLTKVLCLSTAYDQYTNYFLIKFFVKSSII